jgi:transglutaminase-like putative cysteine protease
MRLRAAHVTRYNYAETVSTCHTEVRLAPRERAGQARISHNLDVSPAPNFSASREDYFGNEVISFSIEQPHKELVVSSESLTDVDPAPPPNLSLSPSWEDVREEVLRHAAPASFEAFQFIFESPLIRRGPEFAEYAKECFEPGRRFLDGVTQLSERIFEQFRYDTKATTVATPVEEALKSRSGVCQDFAHVMIACVRSLNLPARYVSGYVRSRADFAGAEASHAWVSVWCPMFGWQDFDPTNNIMPQGDHITLAWGRDYSDVAPVKGVALGGGEQSIRVSVEVTEAEDE